MIGKCKGQNCKVYVSVKPLLVEQASLLVIKH